MRPSPLSSEAATAIYTALRLVGASPHSQENFVHTFTGNDPPREWRFQGIFGFGGKFWLDWDGWRVSCYSEDENPERLNRLQTCTELLMLLYAKFSKRSEKFGLLDFLQTGHLGPIVRNMTPKTAEMLLGEPEDRSIKTSPLILRYFNLELSFWAPHKELTPRLCLVELKVPEPGKPQCDLVDWGGLGPVSREEFRAFLKEHEIFEYPGRIGLGEMEISLNSGVVALFEDDRLVRFFQR